MTDDQSGRRARTTVRRYESAAEADRRDLEFWQQLSPAERVRLVWQLSEQQFRLAGHVPHERGFSRSVARVHRR
jgi:hypothetical protein